MAFSLKLSEIADAIAGLSISGVTVKDRNEISPSWVGTPYVFYPRPDDWITDFVMEYQAFPRGAAAAVNVSYTLNYRLLGVQTGDLAIFTQAYSNLVDKIILTINALAAMDAPYSGGVNMEIQNITNLRPLSDPAGNMFFGCDIALRVEEIQ